MMIPFLCRLQLLFFFSSLPPCSLPVLCVELLYTDLLTIFFHSFLHFNPNFVACGVLRLVRVTVRRANKRLLRAVRSRHTASSISLKASLRDSDMLFNHETPFTEEPKRKEFETRYGVIVFFSRGWLAFPSYRGSPSPWFSLVWAVFHSTPLDLLILIGPLWFPRSRRRLFKQRRSLCVGSFGPFLPFPRSETWNVPRLNNVKLFLFKKKYTEITWAHLP